MVKLKLVILVIVIFSYGLGNRLYAQELFSKDSLISKLKLLPEGKLKAKIYLEIAEFTYSRQGKYNEAKQWADTCYIIAKANNCKQELMLYWYFMASYARKQSKSADALEYANAALKVCNNLADSAFKSHIICEIATIYRWADNYEPAVKNYLHALSLARQYKQQEIELYALNGIGNAYTILKSFDIAMEYYNKALDIAVRLNNKQSLAVNLNNIGEVHELQHNPIKAENFYKESLKINEETQNVYGISISHTSIGNLAFNKGEYTNALKHYLKAYEIEKTEKSSMLLFKAKINLGKCYTKLKKYQTALTLLKEGLKGAEAIQSKLVLKDAYFYLANAYGETSKHELAYNMIKRYAEVSEKIFDSETVNTISILQVQFNLQKYETKLLLLTKKNENQELRKRKNLYIYGAVSTTIFLLLLSLMLFRTSLNRKKNAKRLTEKNNEINKINSELTNEIEIRTKAETKVRQMLLQKDVLISEIHHRVKNNLAMVSGLLHLELSKITDNNSRIILTNTNNRIQAIALVHENLYNSETDAHIVFSDYLLEQSRKVIDSLNSNIKVNLYVETEKISLSLHQAVPVSLILNELISNAIYHSFSPSKINHRLIIKMFYEAENIVLTVQDNGIGIDKNMNINKAETAGFLIVSIFVKQLKGHFYIENDGNGSKFSLKFKETKMKVWK